MVYYIGFYVDEKNAENRKVYLSAVNKMRYIINTIEKSGMKQQIVSYSMTTDKKGYPSSLQKISENVYLKQFKTFGRGNILTKLLDRLCSKLQFVCYLLKNVKASDTLLVYHSPAYCKEIAFVKKVKKCKLVLEVEEIYGDVSCDKTLRKKELSLCKKADAFVFPTDMLSKAVNISNRPFVIIHGTYQVEKDRGVKFNDGKIHIVYAGTFDPRKGGTMAVQVAEFLDKNYHVHILGFGTDDDKKNLLNEIERVTKSSECIVTYDGCFSGEEYIEFIQSCDIGLSPQNPDAEFNATSFPSKILSYMANGLRVVSIKISAIEKSAVGKYLYYYTKQVPKEIARVIKNIDSSKDYNGRKVIMDLDEQFTVEIMALVGE